MNSDRFLHIMSFNVMPTPTTEFFICGMADREFNKIIDKRNNVRYILGLHRPDIRPFLYPVSGRISGFVCRISGWPDSRISGQKNFTWHILSSKLRSLLNIIVKFRKTVKVFEKMSTGCFFCDTL